MGKEKKEMTYIMASISHRRKHGKGVGATLAEVTWYNMKGSPKEAEKSSKVMAC